MDPIEGGKSMRLFFRWGSHRSRWSARAEQPSWASISHPPIEDEMEEDQGAAIPPLPPKHSMSEWVDLFNQAVTTVVASSSSSQIVGWEVVNVEF